MPPTPQPFMSEPTRVYCCPTCGFELMPMLEYQALWALRAGGMLQTEAHGLCMNCGGAVHFQINTQRLQRLLSNNGVQISEQELNQRQDEP